MSISVGDKLGPYEILALIGAGGMGEVYRARDSRLGRDVAIKVSAERFSERFEQEARAIASLNHPNVCTLHDVGPNYLVMELVEGATLAERIKKGAIPLEEALAMGRQISDALAAAHDKGIVHRDLKPANLKITPQGMVKVLDFGLAKAVPEPSASEDSSTLAAESMDLTQAGEIVGTVAYMAPEQVQGMPASKRADIWAFGVVLYEMLTGRRLFRGATLSDTLAAVLKDQPEWDRVPAQVQRLLRSCLEKDPNKRLRDIGDVWRLLDDAPAGPQSAIPAPTPAKKIWLPYALAAAAVIAAGAVLFLWAPWRTPTPTQAVRFEIGPAEKMTFINGGAMAVSPDGRWMVFPATGEDGVARYWIRALDGVEVRALPGTESTIAAPPPASWSADSRWVIFAMGNKLKKVDIQGGLPQNLADFPGFLNGADSNSDGVIITGATGAGSPILRVPESGGQATPVTALAAGESAHRFPQFLPDGKHFLYFRVSSDASKTGVYVGSLDAQPNQQSMQRLLANDRQAYYAPAGGTGYLIFLRQTALMAQSFDPDKMTLSGQPAIVADGVDSYAARNYGLFSVSKTGTLAYRGGSGSQTTLAWFDQLGKPEGTLGDSGEYSTPAISPDGSRVAVAVGPSASRDIRILDVARGGSTQFTFDPARDDYPAWSPDGKYIAFSSDRGGQSSGKMDLYSKPADGSGEEKLLLKTDEPKTVDRWTKDSRFLLFNSTGPRTNGDIWALPFPAEAKAVPLLQTQFNEGLARVSPDGRWLAYVSPESGPVEVYVRPFTPEAPAGTGAKWLISRGGGTFPIWGPNGKSLFYLSLAGQVMAVDVGASNEFQPATPRRLFASPPLALTLGWDLTPDGKRFLFVAPPGSARVIPFTVVLNWAAALKK